MYMSGIIFLSTKDLESITRFYQEKIGMTTWLDQKSCKILQHGNLLLGFCEKDHSDTDGVVTFFFSTKEEVEQHYKMLKEIVTSQPKENPRYGIYHFFAKDPEGRDVEFQSFLHPVLPFETSMETLVQRRSIREFTAQQPGEDVLNSIFETCRFAPTSMNTESYYFKIIKDRETIELVAGVRGSSSSPIAKAPLAIAICSDPHRSKRHVQDGCIAAYHFLLAARAHGLGTCWIAAMDRDDVKQALGIPQDHYVATVTPLGYPASKPKTPKRRNAVDMVQEL